MGRKISVLYVGTSNETASALADQGFNVTVNMSHASHNPAADRDHPLDVVAFETASVANDEAQLLLLSADEIVRRAQVASVANARQAVSRCLVAADSVSGADLREIVDGLPGVVLRCALSSKSRIGFVSERAERLFGVAKRQVKNWTAGKLLSTVHPSDRRRLLRVLRSARDSGRPFGIEHRLVFANGDEKWLWHHGCIRDGRHGKELESFLVDITERKYEEQQLAYLARHDSLTGVANRTSFLELMAKSLRRAERNDEIVACLFIDLDRFKAVNDALGHDVGDELLRQASRRLRRCVRGNDVVGRLGGDEFAVLLDGINESGDAFTVATKILEELERPFVISGHRLVLSASIGISCFPDDACEAGTLLRNADTAMYSVKNSGRASCRFHSSEMSRRAYASLAQANALRGAIESGQLQLRYRPRFELAGGQLAALEMCCHWEPPGREPLDEERLRALAEDAGLANALGEQLLRSACRQLAVLGPAKDTTLRVATTVSARQFRDPGFVREVAAAVRDAGVKSAQLEIDVPEPVLVQDRAAARKIVGGLKEIGVQVVVSAFGTAACPLPFLRQLGLDGVKIDRTMLDGVPGDADSVAVFQALVSMAERMDLRVATDGVDSDAHRAFVQAVGCNEAQGEVLGSTLTETDLVALPGSLSFDTKRAAPRPLATD